MTKNLIKKFFLPIPMYKNWIILFIWDIFVLFCSSPLVVQIHFVAVRLALTLRRLNPIVAHRPVLLAVVVALKLVDAFALPAACSVQREIAQRRLAKFLEFLVQLLQKRNQKFCMDYYYINPLFGWRNNFCRTKKIKQIQLMYCKIRKLFSHLILNSSKMV